jgi:hypothetical protein
MSARPKIASESDRAHDENQRSCPHRKRALHLPCKQIDCPKLVTLSFAGYAAFIVTKLGAPPPQQIKVARFIGRVVLLLPAQYREARFFPGTGKRRHQRRGLFGFLLLRLFTFPVAPFVTSGHFVSPNKIQQESFHDLAGVLVVVRGFVIEKPLRSISSATILGMP